MPAKSTRPAAVAGTFYPADPAELRDEVDRMLASASTGAGPRPKALIVPHAGYVYSGPIAASGYARVRPLRGVVRDVVLLGPAHRVFVRGLATTSASTWETPLGRIEIAQDRLAPVLELEQVQVSDRAHATEHSLEVHLPFLQEALGTFRLAPFAVGDASREEVAEVLDRLWGGEETLIVVSSDLSHYYDYDTAKRMDAATARAIQELDSDGIGEEQACGRVPVRGLLEVARRRGLHVETLDLRSSGDTAGSRGEVVGYGAWALS